VPVRTGRAYIGISGYEYKRWRDRFYPPGLPARQWLEYASRRFNSIEINGTFYSLKWPSVFERWRAEAPKRDFIFALKGGQFITHNLKLRRSEAALGNFFASGVLALGRLTGPILWQLPATYGFDAERMDEFMKLLPRNARDIEEVASWHDHRLKRGALTEAAAPIRLRHAFEVRHPSYFQDEFYALLRRHKCGFVIADTAGRFPYAEEITADFVYVRLHGSQQLYVSGYSETELCGWAAKLREWTSGDLDGKPRDVYVYFDNDAKVHAPHDALRLTELAIAAGVSVPGKSQSPLTVSRRPKR
jgi:uncharacterized protein YecE (DUF72 family)